MTAFVLVHGAFRGGWSWSRVQPLLVEAGHEVHAPTLSGRADGLEAWVDEVVGLLTEHDLDGVVLVGHSQGGVVVREVAVRVPERLAHLVYLDAAVPDPGERAVDVAPTPPVPAQLPAREALIPPRPLTPGGDLDVATAQWVNDRLTPTPFAPSLDPVSSTEPGVEATYAFFADTPAGYPCATTRSRLDARARPYVVLEGGHDAPLTRPDAVAGLLLGCVPPRQELTPTSSTSTTTRR